MLVVRRSDRADDRDLDLRVRLASIRVMIQIRHPNAHEATTSAAYSVARTLLLCCAFAFPFLLMMDKSITGDEVAHIPAGYTYLRTHEIVLNPMHPPLVKELAALPLLWAVPNVPVDADKIREIGKPDFTYQWRFGEEFLVGRNLQRLLFWSRLAPIALSFSLAVVIMAWSKELWGRVGALLSLLLYVFDPTITAHAQLVTTDVGCALFSTLFLYRLRRFVFGGGSAQRLVCGAALGLALGAKFSAVILIPLAAVLLAAIACNPPNGPSTASLPARLTRRAFDLAIICMIAYAVLWSLYFFPRDPFFYLEGMRDVSRDHNPEYFHFYMGDFRHGSWPTYFLVAALIKTPIPELILVFATIPLAVGGWRSDWREEMFVILPLVVIFAGYAALASPIGVRYVIPCLPFVFIAAGRVGQALSSARRALQLAAAGLAVWLVAEFYAIWPDHLSYFNQIAGGARGGVAWLDDSNVDWGQGFLELRRYVSENRLHDYRLCNFGYLNPAYYGLDGELIWLDALIPPPAPGTLIMSSHCVARVSGWLQREYGDGRQNWLAHVAPKAIVGHAYWIFDIETRQADG
jgi:hypothetical protein